MELARQVYLRTEEFPKSETFGLRMQMRRSAVSVASHIAEGHGKLTDADLRKSSGLARGSLYEFETQNESGVRHGLHGKGIRASSCLNWRRKPQSSSTDCWGHWNPDRECR